MSIIMRFFQLGALEASRLSNKHVHHTSPHQVIDARTPKRVPRPQRQRSLGVDCLCDPNGATIDIVAIHGLDGHRKTSWTMNTILWLRDLLPLDIPTARILTYGYDAATTGMRPLSEQTVDGHANDFLAKLTAFRRRTGTTRRPIIFVAHSLGGIILKLALLKANLSNIRHSDGRPEVDLKLSTYGILFLGTPHQGTRHIDLLMVLKRIKSALIGLNVNMKILKHLERNSEVLKRQRTSFRTLSSVKYDTKFLYEKNATPVFGWISSVLVPKSSAVLRGSANTEAIPLHRDHIRLSKFVQRDEDYMLLLGLLEGMVEKAEKRINDNWNQYERARSKNLPEVP